ncbi:MAG: YceI family protein [Bacteroidetes bacterium]|nr:YceI family protein [Bacteroidota bacterium]
MKNLILAMAVVLLAGNIKAQQTLTPTDEGSKVHFVIKNFGIKTGGDFTGLKGTIRFDKSTVADWAFDVTVDASTIDTDNDTRDRHLKKAEYFDVKQFPTIRMVSTKISTTDKPGIYQFKGNITIKGVSKVIEFPFKVNNSNGGYLFTGTFDMNRRDFGVGGDSVSMADSLRVNLSVFAK